MTINDVHRERHQPTLGRLLVSAMSILSGVALPIATWYTTAVRKPGRWTVKGDLVPLWLANIGLFSATILVETRVYDSFRRNWRSARANGYSAARILSHFVTLLVFSGAVPIAVVAYEGELAKPRLDLSVAVRFLAAVVAADALWFKYAHRFMHRHLPVMHQLHHCCFAPSFSSNFYFNVLDFIAEFGGPILGGFVAYKTDLLGQKDPFTYFLYATFVQLFYIMDHDRLIQNEHYRHHTLLNCNFFVYWWKPQPRDPEEKLRVLLVRNEEDKVK